MPRPRTAPPVVLSFSLASGSGAFACTRPNPAYDGGGDSGSSTTVAAEVSVSSGGGLDGTGDTGSSGDPGPACGNGIVEPGEDCDNGDTNDDGCTIECTIPRSCAEILAIAPDSPSGPYRVDPGGSGEPWPVICDMDLDGGGWTGFEVDDTCNGHLTSELVAITPARFEGFDGCRPYAEYIDGGALGYTLDIEFPPGFSAFFLRDYTIKAIGEPDIRFVQELWEQPYAFPNGAVSFGDANAPGPITTWADEGETPVLLDGDVALYPAQDSPFELPQGSTALRIGWGERGIYSEGLYPWWSGRIFVR